MRRRQSFQTHYRARGHHGSATVELVLLAPLLVVLALFVVYLGRTGSGLQTVRHAADTAARAASAVRVDRMQTVAAAAARHDLLNNGVNCKSSSVQTSVDTTPRASAVTVTVSCVINDDGLSLLGAAPQTLSAQSTEVIDRFRAG